MQELAGRIADGVVLGLLAGLEEQALPACAKARPKQMRPPGQVEAVLWTPCSISEDGREAFEAVKPQVARRLLSAAERGALSEEEIALTEPLRKAYDFRHHMGAEHSALVPDQLVDRYAVAGTPSQVRSKIEEVRAIAGIHEVAIIPWGRDPEAVIQAFARGVIRPLRG